MASLRSVCNISNILLNLTKRTHCTLQPVASRYVASSLRQSSSVNYGANRTFHQCISKCSQPTGENTTEPKVNEARTEEDTFSIKAIEDLLQMDENQHKDMPLVGMPNPYDKPRRKCILCEHKVHVDHKNVRLLSQFVSPHTGQIYGRHITGLCVFMQRYLAKCIKRSRMLGFMSYTLKNPQYLRDPKLFDPFKRTY